MAAVDASLYIKSNCLPEMRKDCVYCVPTQLNKITYDTVSADVDALLAVDRVAVASILGLCLMHLPIPSELNPRHLQNCLCVQTNCNSGIVLVCVKWDLYP